MTDDTFRVIPRAEPRIKQQVDRVERASGKSVLRAQAFFAEQKRDGAYFRGETISKLRDIALWKEAGEVFPEVNKTKIERAGKLKMRVSAAGNIPTMYYVCESSWPTWRDERANLQNCQDIPKQQEAPRDQ